jgi:hypothetical protein
MNPSRRSVVAVSHFTRKQTTLTFDGGGCQSAQSDEVRRPCQNHPVTTNNDHFSFPPLVLIGSVDFFLAKDFVNY